MADFYIWFDRVCDWIERSKSPRQLYYRYHRALSHPDIELEEDLHALWLAKERARERLKWERFWKRAEPTSTSA
jgi:hypothetical protein